MRASLGWTAIAVLLATSLPGAPAAAADRELAGATMAERVRLGEEVLVLNGMALHRRGIFDVYVAGLYLPDPQEEWHEVLEGDTTRRIVVHWLRSVEQESLCRMWRDGVRANAPDARGALDQELETLCRWTKEARTGDRFIFDYVPGRGTTLTIDARRRGTVPGKPFADALFGLWIGPEPAPGQAFRAALMGQG